ncbi:MAG TPA: small ribosomal subunit Rsm22 family protein [Candidatus Angelobacter sp.]|nr:small ribosomal subunit Rsm22 family protein [Candidatus Angelobacter sp.]
MRVAQYLLDAIQGELEKIERRRLAQAAARLTERYKAGNFSHPAIASDAERAAYLAVRFPATYAANRRVFSEIALRAPHAEIRTLLDLGAGPGTALFAASEIFPKLETATLLEADERWVAIGKTLAEKSGPAAVPQPQWLRQDLRSGFSCAEHDLVVVSYALGELAPAALEGVIRKAWSCAREFLAIIEPGTPRGFATVNAARSALIAAGAEILAPCPHKRPCPMAAAADWCHFAQRLERTTEHRQLKGGALGYEDEKFSYVIAARQSVAEQRARIVRHPGKHSGHIQLELCTSKGRIESKMVTRSDKQAFRAARKAEWGDVWEE